MKTSRRDFLKLLGISAAAIPAASYTIPVHGKEITQTFNVGGQYWILEATRDGKEWEVATQGPRYKKYRLQIFPEGTIKR